MNAITLKPERLAELEEYALRRGQDTASALDDALAAYLDWERRDYQEAVEAVRRGYEAVRRGYEAVRRGYEDVKAGRTRPAEVLFADLRRKHGLPG